MWVRLTTWYRDKISPNSRDDRFKCASTSIKYDGSDRSIVVENGLNHDSLSASTHLCLPTCRTISMSYVHSDFISMFVFKSNRIVLDSECSGGLGCANLYFYGIGNFVVRMIAPAGVVLGEIQIKQSITFNYYLILNGIGSKTLFFVFNHHVFFITSNK